MTKIKSFDFPLVHLTLIAQAISLVRTEDVFSICWMGNPQESNSDLWLNGTSLKNLWTNHDDVVSLTVPLSVENNVTLSYAGKLHSWTFKISRDPKQTKVNGSHKPQERPTKSTQSILDLLTPTDVFPCENDTWFFYQEKNFFLAFGHTVRFRVKVVSRSPTTLLLSWLEGQPAPVGNAHMMTLYYSDQNFYQMLEREEMTDNPHHVTSLKSCTLYVVCVDTEANFLVTCLPALTDPVIPRDFKVSSLNSSSITLTWDFPENLYYSFFFLTSFYLNGSNHLVKEVPVWHTADDFVFTLSGLQPCSRVLFGLQTVCQAGTETRYSGMIETDGNIAHSSIGALRQTSFGPENYTLSWMVSPMSSISKFNIYHEDVLQGTTFATDYVVTGLTPCRFYRARVEALCGDGVLISTELLPVHTGPRGVLELRYHTNDSKALWIPGSQSPALSFFYKLSLENGPLLQKENVTETELQLPGLETGKTYVLELWERCDNRWVSGRTELCFTVDDSIYGFLARGVGLDSIKEDRAEEIYLLRMVVPGSIPDDLGDEMAEVTTIMVESVQNLLMEVLSEVHPPIRVEALVAEPAIETKKTQVQLMLFDSSHQDDYMPLPVQFYKDYIESKDDVYISVRDGIIYWEGPDLCAPSTQPVCLQNSQCINTLGSHHCACKSGYYDVSAVLQGPVPSYPVCNEKGIFSQCLDKVMTGGVAKPYLNAYIGGKVDVVLNNATCQVEETGMLFHFSTLRHGTECGTKRRVNETHIEFQNTLAVSLTKDKAITRRDLKVIWKCVYPLHYIRDAHVSIDLKWLKAYSVVEFNSSLQLGLTMDLFSDKSFSESYSEFVSMDPEDTLYFQVALDADLSFAANVLLHVESCWATETSDPQDEVQGLFLKDGCPIDYTFRWLSVNGVAQKSRFAMQMFHMPEELPLYFHCLASICGLKENCTKNCTSPRRAKRAANILMDSKSKRAAVVSAGPLSVKRQISKVTKPSWMETMMMISIVAGLVGILGLAVLTVSAAKAIVLFNARRHKK
ncbi:uromodulin-like 1 [Corythoichthys intestinalis]|uniref:uromodulin-like 1 n=1 Tax=Corythoichthys intestinalis TaxID=161448 RepID=UPI0025A5452E|nr:uromodulin-like 1 [Corythoichthys intestinalis]XP_057710151.1 uromodulin-like 1 [Corythoichthys intestinalis]XP_057710152.1 uromodulin-like 1 [Corythoichthys intestinalis]XP_057710153.1 uromodulin-like 1 [Corythoichthys intestinalis]